MENIGKAIEVCVFCCKPVEIVENEHNNVCVENLNEDSAQKVRLKRFVNFLERFCSFGGEKGAVPLNSDSNNVLEILSKLLGCCGMCGVVVEGFCEDYHELKCLEMKMESKLQCILETMELAGRVPSRFKNVKKIFEQSTNSITSKVDDLQYFKSYREQIVKRCNNRLSKSQPRVLLKKKSNSDNLTDCDSETCGIDPESLSEQEIDDMIKSVKLETDDREVLADEGIVISTETLTTDREVAAKFQDMEIGAIHISEDEKVKQESIEDQSSEENVSDFQDEMLEYSSDTSLSDEDEIPDDITCTEMKAEQEMSSPKTIQCTRCESKFTSEQGLKIHVQKMHDLHHYCCKCGESFQTRYLLKKHNLTHNPTDFQCSICEQVFVLKELLEAHMANIHHQGDPMPCEICQKIFYSEKYLRKHMSRVHTDRTLKCSGCPKTFKTKQCLQQHATIHENPEKWKWQCNRCGSRHHQKSQYNRHIKDCRGKKKRKSKEDEPICEFCNAKFGTRRELGRHVRKEHVDKGDVGDCKIFVCDECGMQFISKRMLQGHVSRVHTESSFQCLECGKCFKTKQCLIRHEVIHQGSSERNVQCTECGKMWRNKMELARHMKMHDEKRTPVICDICGMEVFYIKDHMRRKHKPGSVSKAESDKAKTNPGPSVPVPCDKCGTTFPTAYRMRRHKRRVHPEGSHKCSVCLKLFESQVNLSRHMIVHTGTTKVKKQM